MLLPKPRSATRAGKPSSSVSSAWGEWILDLKRYKQDKEINRHKYAKVFEENELIKTDYDNKYWEDINVGDLVEIQKNEEIPADILILQSSLPTGMCFVDTMNLDGETNLKEKMVPLGLKEVEKEKLILSSGNIICNLPDENLEKWESILNIYGFKNRITCKYFIIIN